MKSLHRVVYITCPKGSKSKSIAKHILKNRLGACVNILPSVRSLYWWNGKISSDSESLLIVKTQKNHLRKLIALIQKIHPYSVPEVIALPIVSGYLPYLKWVTKETRTAR